MYLVSTVSIFLTFHVIMADQCENKIKKSERFISRPHSKEEEKNRIVSGGNGSKKNGDRSERSRGRKNAKLSN